MPAGRRTGVGGVPPAGAPQGCRRPRERGAMDGDERAIEMTNFLQLSFAGLALGSLYALVALGFVVIYKATGVINFAQGGLVVLGAYLTYNAHHTWHVPFFLAIP